MKLENQVVSLKYAKKLKELGFKQKSLYVWFESANGWVLEPESIHKKIIPMKEANLISAYTVAELGEILPDRIKDFKIDICRNPIVDDLPNGEWIICYTPISYAAPSLAFIKSKTSEANARAKMLIYLKENKLI